MILAERDRILEERHSLLNFSKNNTEGGATNELCRQLQEVISEKQVLQAENETLKRDNDQLRKDKQTLLEQRDAAQFRYATLETLNLQLKFVFRVGALEAEKAHAHVAIKMDGSDANNQQVAAQAMLIENLRQDVSRLNAENQRLLGFIPKPRRNQLYIISEENTRLNSRPSPNRRPSSGNQAPPKLGKLENSNV